MMERESRASQSDAESLPQAIGALLQRLGDLEGKAAPGLADAAPMASISSSHGQ
jgi:hypothetical protein